MHADASRKRAVGSSRGSTPRTVGRFARLAAMQEERRLTFPDDPTGIQEPHDVLAAEDFAMPSGPDRIAEKLRSGGARSPLAIFAAAAGFAALVAARRRRR